MRNIDSNAPYCLQIKPTLSAEEERMAKNRELERRERKVNLYSYPPTVKSHITLM